MMKKRRLSKAIRRLPLAGAIAGLGFLLHSCTEAEAEPQPDPKAVQRFLAQMEADEQLISGEARKKKGYEKRIRSLVESAAVRAPSDASLNRLETAVAGAL